MKLFEGICKYSFLVIVQIVPNQQFSQVFPNSSLLTSRLALADTPQFVNMHLSILLLPAVVPFSYALAAPGPQDWQKTWANQQASMLSVLNHMGDKPPPTKVAPPPADLTKIEQIKGTRTRPPTLPSTFKPNRELHTRSSNKQFSVKSYFRPLYPNKSLAETRTANASGFPTTKPEKPQPRKAASPKKAPGGEEKKGQQYASGFPGTF